MDVFGLAGWSGSGKTTLIVALLPLLRAQGLTVSTIKHAHHGFDMDRPGKDSFRHREAGAYEVMVASDTRWVLMHEAPAGLPALLARMQPVDLVLVEGFHADPHPKLEVHRPSLGRRPLWPQDPGIVAVAADAPLDDAADPPPHCLDLNDPAKIADWVVKWRHLSVKDATGTVRAGQTER